MELQEIIQYLIVGGVAFWLGCTFTNFWNRVVFKQILDDLGVSQQQLEKLAHDVGVETSEETAELERVSIKIEQHQGILYAFREDTDQFIAQGSDRESLIDAIAKRMTNVRLVIKEENGAELVKDPA